MLRVALICTALLAPVLCAQDNEPLTGSVPQSRRLTFLYRADFGPAAVSFSIACGLTTPSASGLVVRLIDIDAVAGSGALPPPGIDEAGVPGVGTANASLAGSYSGQHEFAVEVESGGAGSAFTGNLTSNAGTLELISSDQLVLTAKNLRVTVARRGLWDGITASNQTVAASFELDLGPVPRTIFFRFEVDGVGLNQVQVIDSTGGTSVVLATLSQGDLPDATAVPLTGSGIKTLRVNVRGAVGVAGSAAWAATSPSGVAMSAVGDPGTGGSDDDDGCAVARAKGLPLILPLLAAFCIARRRAMPRRAVIW